MMIDHKYKNIKKVHKLVMCKFIVEDFLTPKKNLREITHSLGGYFNSRAKKISVLITLYFKKNFHILFHEIFSLRQKSVLLNIAACNVKSTLNNPNRNTA